MIVRGSAEGQNPPMTVHFTGAPRTRALIVGCLLCLLLTGCSATQLIYNRVDILIRWYLDDYVTLTADQQSRFDDRLDHLLAWHRAEELPAYIEIIDCSEAALDEGVPLASAYQIAGDIEMAFNRLEQPFLTLLLETGMDLEADQLAKFVEVLAAKQSEFEEDRLTRDDEEYRTDLEERVEDQLDDYLGPLTGEQRARIAEGVAEMTRLDRFWLEDRKVWINELAHILSSDQPDWPDQVRTLIDGREAAQLPAYREGIEHNGDVILVMLRDVMAERTPRQDRKIRSRLSSLRDDFAILTGQS